MFKNFRQQKGSALLGLLLVIVIIAALAYGSSFFWTKKDANKINGSIEGTLKNYNKAKDDIEGINKTISKKNEMINKVLNETTENRKPASQRGEQTTGEGDLSIEEWRVYEKPEMNIQLKYHKDWYYNRDEKAEKELGYDLYVGFAESPEILEQGRAYPIEFMIWPSGVGILDASFCEYKILKEKDNKKYILSTCDYNKYSEIIKKMAESFEYMKDAKAL